jgi:hypothetical protein
MTCLLGSRVFTDLWQGSQIQGNAYEAMFWRDADAGTDADAD